MYDYNSHERFHDPRREEEESDEWAEDIASRKEYLQQRAQKMREKENLKNENQAPSTETIHEADVEEEFDEIEEEAAEGFGRSSIKKQKRKIRFSGGGDDELTTEQKKLFRRFGIKPKQLTAETRRQLTALLAIHPTTVDLGFGITAKIYSNSFATVFIAEDDMKSFGSLIFFSGADSPSTYKYGKVPGGIHFKTSGDTMTVAQNKKPAASQQKQVSPVVAEDGDSTKEKGKKYSDVIYGAGTNEGYWYSINASTQKRRGSEPTRNTKPTISEAEHQQADEYDAAKVLFEAEQTALKAAEEKSALAQKYIEDKDHRARERANPQLREDSEFPILPVPELDEEALKAAGREAAEYRFEHVPLPEFEATMPAGGTRYQVYYKGQALGFIYIQWNHDKSFGAGAESQVNRLKLGYGTEDTPMKKIFDRKEAFQIATDQSDPELNILLKAGFNGYRTGLSLDEFYALGLMEGIGGLQSLAAMKGWGGMKPAPGKTFQTDELGKTTETQSAEGKSQARSANKNPRDGIVKDKTIVREDEGAGRPKGGDSPSRVDIDLETTITKNGSQNNTSLNEIISLELRTQKQENEHTLGGKNVGTNSYLNSIADAKIILESTHNGSAKILHVNINQNRVYVGFQGVTGYYNNFGEILPTHLFLIKGGKSATVIPIHPSSATFK